MSKLIENTPFPRTREMLRTDMRDLGLKRGMNVLVHSSLSSVGWVNGGAVAIIQALMDTVTEEGTIIMPAQSADLSDPAEWLNPPIPWEWWETVRNTMPAFEPAITPTYGMGKIAELFRTYPGVLRSDHPNVSFTAWGKRNGEILANHQLENGLGEGSPLRKLYDLDAHVLFIGTSYETNTCFHLAEYRSGTREVIQKGTPILVDGERKWVEYTDIEYDDTEFDTIGNAFEQQYSVRKGKIGSADSKLFSFCEAVDYAVEFFKNEAKAKV